MKNLHLKLVPLGIVLLVAGCGGGGGSSSSGGGGSTVPTAAVKITSSATATKVASGVNSSTQTVASSGSTANGSLGVRAAVQSTGVRHSVLEIVSTEFNRALNTKLPPATASVVGAAAAAGPVVISHNCGTNANVAENSANSFTLTANYSNGSTATAGDSISFSFTSCTFASTPTVTANGSMTFAIASLTGSAGAYSGAGYSVTFANFTSSNSSTSESSAINGDMTISASVDGTGYITTSIITGSSLSVSSTVSGVTDSMKIYGNGTGTNLYNETYTDNSVTHVYTYNTNYTVASTGMNGSVSVATTLDFTGTGAGNPTHGSMKITGGPATSGGPNTYVIVTANSDGLRADLTIFDGTNTTNSSVLWTAL